MKTFISHSSVDEEFVLRLANDLRLREGIDAWLDQWEIRPGDRIPERIEEGLAKAEVFLLVLSPGSINSQWVEYERQAWLMLQIDEERRARDEYRVSARRLIPVLYRDCQKPPFLQPIQHVTITDEEYETGLKQLVDALRDEPTNSQFNKGSVMPRVHMPGVPRRKYALTLLKCLLPSQFEEVVFGYNVPSAHLPTEVSQVQRAITVIEYAEQREGEAISELLDAIYQVAPHLRRGHT